MSKNTAVIPLKELSSTQLIAVIHRLQDEIEQFYKKNDAEIRRENQALYGGLMQPLHGGALVTSPEQGAGAWAQTHSKT